jgi:hypothetical protein
MKKETTIKAYVAYAVCVNREKVILTGEKDCSERILRGYKGPVKGRTRRFGCLVEICWLV